MTASLDLQSTDADYVPDSAPSVCMALLLALVRFMARAWKRAAQRS